MFNWTSWKKKRPPLNADKPVITQKMGVQTVAFYGAVSITSFLVTIWIAALLLLRIDYGYAELLITLGLVLITANFVRGFVIVTLEYVDIFVIEKRE